MSLTGTTSPKSTPIDARDAAAALSALPQSNVDGPRRRVQWAGLGSNSPPADWSGEDSAATHGLGKGGVPQLELSMPEPADDDVMEKSYPDTDDEDANHHRFTSGGSRDITPDSSRPGTPDSDLDIMPGERDGLPSNVDRRPRTFAKEAAHLVALHKWRTKAASTASNSGLNPASSASGRRIASAASRNSVARNAKHGDHLPVTGGVLSHLLRLYDQPSSTRSSKPTLVEDLSEDEGGDLRQTPPINNPRQQLKKNLSKISQLISRDSFERPKAARSSGGVFGALQMSAMGLGGIATPTAAHIAPDPARPGFKLARYAIEDDDDDSPHSDHHVHKDTSTIEKSDIAELAEHQHDTVHLSTEHWRDRGDSGQASASRSGASTPNKEGQGFGSYSRNQSYSGLNLKALGDALNPHHYYNQSAVLKAKHGGVTPPGRGSLSDDHFRGQVVKPGPKEQALRKRKERRRQEEIFITMHVAAILQRQQFILQLTRALMMFGGPSHRLETQIQSTARVLELDLQIILIFSVCIFSFQDESTHTSETKFIKQSASVDLGKLTDIATLHWEVVHDKIGVSEASSEISRLMKKKPGYRNWQIILIGSLCSGFIGPAAFSSSFIDVLVSIPLGALLVTAQLFVASKSDVFSQIFEILVTGLASFIAAALASTKMFCYSAVISSSIVLILPGWLVCNAALELESRSIVSGSVRLIWSIIYALFLGLGISFGAQFWQLFSGDAVVVDTNGKCAIAHPIGSPWYQQTMSLWWAFLVVPGYSFMLSLRQFAKLQSKETLFMVVFACAGWSANHFAGKAFPNRPDISSSLGSLVVGLLANVYGKFFQGTAFIVALVPILFQLPSGLSNGGLLNFAAADQSSDTFSSGFSVAQQLIEVSLGLVIGLFVAQTVVYPFGNRRGGLMTF